MKVGVLALQGDVPEHLRALTDVVPKTSVVAVRRPADLAEVDALFLPGGESTTIARLLAESGLWAPLAHRLGEGFPVLGTCAGLILLARDLAPSPAGREPPTFGVLDVRVRRNDYGSQRESFEGPVRVEGVGKRPFPGVFIRAPRILAVGTDARAIAWAGDEVVGVRSGAVWGLSFHPELSGDVRVHRAFLRGLPRSR
ncbi:MAG: pyridoxal 5'-phosphate synthase glutaminase subunit PdxT [Thermoplasmata archaeon]|jgi:5'-phosphate synthase pdxT subunit|nr:pyridoxal 5'-phosphate synthase glutaminase subunit PdxT [Thermoplasmata archaeon]